jgi:hypothetical protein
VSRGPRGLRFGSLCRCSVQQCDRAFKARVGLLGRGTARRGSCNVAVDMASAERNVGICVTLLPWQLRDSQQILHTWPSLFLACKASNSDANLWLQNFVLSLCASLTLLRNVKQASRQAGKQAGRQASKEEACEQGVSGQFGTGSDHGCQVTVRHLSLTICWQLV